MPLLNARIYGRSGPGMGVGKGLPRTDCLTVW